MWFHQQALNGELLLTFESAAGRNIIGPDDTPLMDLKLVVFLSLGRARTFCPDSRLPSVTRTFFKDRRFDLGSRFVTFQSGYLVSQFLNQLLLNPDNLQKSRYQRSALLFRNVRDFQFRAHAPLKHIFTPLSRSFSGSTENNQSPCPDFLRSYLRSS